MKSKPKPLRNGERLAHASVTGFPNELNGWTIGRGIRLILDDAPGYRLKSLKVRYECDSAGSRARDGSRRIFLTAILTP